MEAEKAKQQEAYDANTKAIFAPNQALDDEDVEFFESEQRRRRQALAARDEVEASAFERLREGAGAAALGSARAFRRDPEVISGPQMTGTGATIVVP